MSDTKTDLRQALSLLDLTRLDEHDTPETIEALCRRAVSPYGPVAAVCVYPAFVTVARQTLEKIDGAERVRVATVANFPAGDSAPETVAAQIGRSVAEGADEIDVVFPWRAFLEGDSESTDTLLSESRKACGSRTLKVILETAGLAEAEPIRRAAEHAIEAGADFLKTSTGKGPGGATTEAVRILLETIRESGHEVGCKVSGGVRSNADALTYLALARDIMGDAWATPEHFRFGASGLMDELINALDAGAASGEI